MLFPLALLFLSFIAVPSLFIKRIAWLQNIYDKVKVYRTMIGVSGCAYGILKLIGVILGSGFNWLGLAMAGCMALLGFLVGFQWIAQNIFASSEEARENIRRFYFKVSPYEGTLAIGGFFLAIYCLLF